MDAFTLRIAKSLKSSSGTETATVFRGQLYILTSSVWNDMRGAHTIATILGFIAGGWILWMKLAAQKRDLSTFECLPSANIQYVQHFDAMNSTECLSLRENEHNKCVEFLWRNRTQKPSAAYVSLKSSVLWIFNAKKELQINNQTNRKEIWSYQ